MVSDADILELVERHHPDLDAAARALVDAANAAGGEDNITVVLFAVADDGERSADEASIAAAAADEDTLHGIPSPFAAEAAAAEAEPGRFRVGVVLAATAAVVVVLGGLAVFGLSSSHFVGADETGHIVVYQGVPWDLGFGIHLYRAVYESPLLAANLSQAERRRLFDHDLQSRAAAIRRVNAYARDVVP
jgi:protein phosphatase